MTDISTNAVIAQSAKKQQKYNIHFSVSKIGIHNFTALKVNHKNAVLGRQPDVVK